MTGIGKAPDMQLRLQACLGKMQTEPALRSRA